MKNSEKKRWGTVIRAINDLFVSPTSGKGPRKLRVRDIIDRVPGSSRTRLKARKALLCDAKKIAGAWYWFRPRRTLNEALDYARSLSKNKNSPHLKEKQSDREEQLYLSYLTFLPSMFVDDFKSYCVPVSEIHNYFKHHFVYRRGWGLPRAKRELNISRVMLEDKKWYWIYTDATVHSWLEERLANGPVKKDVLFAEAAKLGYNEAVLWHARNIIGGIEGDYHSWWDINADNRVSAPKAKPVLRKGIQVPGLELH